MQGIYQPECPPSVVCLLIPEEASACLHTPLHLVVYPSDSGQMWPSWEEECNRKVPRKETPPLTSHMHMGWHPSSVVHRGTWEVAVQRAVQGLLRRPVRRRGPVEQLLRDRLHSCPFQTKCRKLCSPLYSWNPSDVSD